MMARRCLQAFLLTNLFISVLCDGVIYLRLKRYDNPRGKLSNGHCCDGKFFVCERNGCDHMFSVCLTQLTRYIGPTCSYGEVITDKIKNRNNNVFGHKVGGVQNPLRFNVSGEIPTHLVLKVTVKDKDTGRFWLGDNDHVESLTRAVRLPRASGQENGLLQNLRGRTSLRYRLWFTCATDYYGPRCAVRCSPPGPHHHYRCDARTGYKICLPGFKGFYCNVPVTTTTTTPRPTTTTSRPTTTTPNTNTDCDDLAKRGLTSGVYSIEVPDVPPFSVYCQIQRDERRGWTVIQRRVSNRLTFNRGWDQYVAGFGRSGEQTNYWMGLERLHRLTSQKSYTLKIELTYGTSSSFAMYEDFRIDDAQSNYQLHVGEYSGNAGDALNLNGTRLHNGMPFSTPDRDNDQWPTGHCARRYRSGWWFNSCYWANLNGPFVSGSGFLTCPRGRCISWRAHPNRRSNSVNRVVMSVSPKP